MTQLECVHCGYEWDYSGSAVVATCPQCTCKTPNTEDS